MYTSLDMAIICICAFVAIGGYITLKVSGVLWYGLNWGRLFYEIRRGICKLLLKIFHK